MKAEESIPVEILDKARLLESTASYLIAHQPNDVAMLESLCARPGFKFKQYAPVAVGGKTVLQMAIATNNRMVFDTVMKHYEGMLHWDDISMINFKSDFCEYAFDSLLNKAEQTQIKKCLVSLAGPWMLPEKCWALKKLKTAVVQKNKKWSWCEKVKDHNVFRDVLLKAMKCGDLGNEWVDEICTSGLLKNVTTWCRYDSYSKSPNADSALVRAILSSDYELAKKMLAAGYNISNTEYMSELEVGIKLNLNVKGINFLLDNGCSPLESNGLLRVTRDIDDNKVLARGSRREREDVDTNRLLGIALEHGRIDLVDSLTKHGLSIDGLLNKTTAEKRSKYEGMLLKKNNEVGERAGVRPAL